MGPLAGVRVLEVRSIGPGPYAGMLLGDLGAEVIVVERSRQALGLSPPATLDVTMRNKKSIALDLKNPHGLETLLTLVADVDVLIEGFRPGVAERLGFGPDVCQGRNASLVYGRVTGWGQTGPLKDVAGHDINYIALTGALAAIGDAESPAVPLNIVGDYAGGSLFLVIGILAALTEAQRSGKGQVVDAAITDGTASLMSLFHSLSAMGVWSTKRRSNLLDGGAPFYGVYGTADERHIAIGALEPKFYAELIVRLGLPAADFEPQLDAAHWATREHDLARLFRSKTRDEWCALLDGTDVCFAPVLDHTEAPAHSHLKARGTYVDVAGMTQPAPCPRFSRTSPDPPTPARAEGSDTEAVLREFGFSDEAIATLNAHGAIVQ